MARWIGIDYGGVRTGLAYTDRLGDFQNCSHGLELMPAIKALVNEAVSGLPRYPQSLGVNRRLTDSSAAIWLKKP